MSELKTTLNDNSVADFINGAAEGERRQDCLALLELFTRVTGEPAKMWGSSIVGFGQYHYKSERSRQEGDWPLTGFSPRKQNLTLYFMLGFDDYADILQKLGKYKTSVGCLYIKKLSDVDMKLLEELIRQSVAAMRQKYGA